MSLGCSPTLCSFPNGECTDDGLCECAAGFFGANCSGVCDCMHGTCDDTANGDGTCSCDTGWAANASGVCSECATGYGPPPGSVPDQRCLDSI